MNTYLHNLAWAFTDGYIIYGIIIAIFAYTFWMVWTVKKVEDTRYIDIVDDIVMPIFVGLLSALLLALTWIIVIPFILLFGINLIIFEIIMKVLIPLYRWIKSIPFLDFRKGEDIDV